MEGDALKDAFGDMGITKVAAAQTGWLARAFALLAALALSFTLAFAAPAPAYAADIDPETQAALQELEEAFVNAYEEAQAEASENGETIEDDGTPLAAAPGGEANDDAASPAEEEILDEENPLTASPYAASVHGFAGVLLGIAAVAALFLLVLTNRLNRNIDKMRRFVD